jgi:hypothetical protein
MLGDVAGGFPFWLFRLDVGRDKFKTTPNDLMSAFIGSMSRNTVWQLVSKRNPLRSRSHQWLWKTVARRDTQNRPSSISLNAIGGTRGGNHITSAEVHSAFDNCVAASQTVAGRE